MQHVAACGLVLHVLLTLRQAEHGEGRLKPNGRDALARLGAEPESPAGACARLPRVVCGTGFARCFPRPARGRSDKSPFGSVAVEFRAQRGVWRSRRCSVPGVIRGGVAWAAQDEGVG